jgi:hypothetical protein
MTAIELKKALFHRIAEIDDISFLNAIKTILDSKSHTKTIVLTSELKKEIIESKKEIEKGHYVEQVALDDKFNKWLSAK